MLSRRGFLRLSVGGAGAVIGAGAYARWVEPHWAQLVEQTMPVAHLPAGLVGRQIVQISDLHVGGVHGLAYLRSVIGWVNRLKPDGVVITGDLMTCRGGGQIEAAVDLVGGLDRPPMGVIATLGNHDYGHRWHRAELGDALADRLVERGVTVLRNRRVTVVGLDVIGIDDWWGPRFDGRGAMRAYRADRPTLVLCHNPDVADLDLWNGYRGWILSGHTHGGQCWLPGVGALILPLHNRRYARGRIDLPDGRTLYVNRGLGYSRRVRFGARPEVTRFTLVPAGARSPSGRGV